MVKDIRPGPSGSGPKQLVVMGNKVYFSAAESTAAGAELWSSDGTPGGTALVKDINPVANQSSMSWFDTNVNRMTTMGGKIYFNAVDNSGAGDEVWSSDGTASGTSMVKNIRLPDVPGADGSFPSDFAATNDKVFFQANDGTHEGELWVSDGTESGTVLVKDINPQPWPESGGPSDMVALGPKVYFSADDYTNGRELWVSDGTPSGTQMVSDIYAGAGNSMTQPDNDSPAIVAMGGKIYFRAYEPAHGDELWVTDGTPGGTSRVVDINLGTSSSAPKEMVAMGGRIYFQANDGSHGVELWSSDGTAAGTYMVKDIRAGSPNSMPQDLASLGDRVYFAANNGGVGEELWVTDGTPGGTSLVNDITPGLNSEGPESLVSMGGSLYFTTSDGVNGGELFRLTPGTPPVPPPSNAFTPPTSGTSVGKKGTLAIGIVLPGPGTLTVNPVGKRVKKGKKVQFVNYTQSTSVNVAGSGTSQVTLVPTRPANKIMKKRSKGKKIGRLQVTVTITFTPTGGTANSKLAPYTLVRP